MNAIHRKVEGPHTILQLFQGLWMQSFEGLKDCTRSFNPSKDCECDPSTLRRIAWSLIPLEDYECNPSTLRRVEGLLTTLQPFEGSHFWSFEGLKDHMHSFNPFVCIKTWCAMKSSMFGCTSNKICGAIFGTWDMSHPPHAVMTRHLTMTGVHGHTRKFEKRR